MTQSLVIVSYLLPDGTPLVRTTDVGALIDHHTVDDGLRFADELVKIVTERAADPGVIDEFHLRYGVRAIPTTVEEIRTLVELPYRIVRLNPEEGEEPFFEFGAVLQRTPETEAFRARGRAREQGLGGSWLSWKRVLGGQPPFLH